MNEDMNLYISAICLIRKKEILKLKRLKPKRIWCKEWMKKRQQYSHVNLIQELVHCPDDFRNYLRMDEETYVELLGLVSNQIKKSDTTMRSAITPHERLSATLRFLSTGRSYEDLKYSTIISKSSLSKIIPETCSAIYNVLQKDYMIVSTSVLIYYRVL